MCVGCAAWPDVTHAANGLFRDAVSTILAYWNKEDIHFWGKMLHLVFLSSSVLLRTEGVRLDTFERKGHEHSVAWMNSRGFHIHDCTVS